MSSSTKLDDNSKTTKNSKTPPENRPSPFQIYVTAARPHTLTASLTPCLVSAALCRPSLSICLLWTAFCLSIQLATNLHNDYADAIQGADDKDKRIGQARATAMGWWSIEKTQRESYRWWTLSLMSSILLILVKERSVNLIYYSFWISTSLLNAFAYTGGPQPLGWLLGHWSIAYSGLGDIFVFLYFGLLASVMMPYLTQATITTEQWITALQMGLLAMNILVVNNVRDRNGDVLVHKMTTAVRFGRTFSLMQYICCMIGAYGLVLVQGYTSASYTTFVPLLSLPLGLKELQAVFTKDGTALNPHVGGAAKVQLVFGLLTCVGALVRRKI